MRTNDIEVTMRIPLRVDTPDANGNIYTKGAVELGCHIFKGAPLVVIDEKNRQRTIGAIDKLEYVEEDDKCYAVASGSIASGGTCESVVTDEEGNNITVKGMTITCVGLNTIS